MKKKVVVITGASSGIGKALAEEYIEKGWRVVMAARNESRLQELKHQFTAKGGEVVMKVTDVSCEADCKALIEYSVAQFGGIDVLINNAGLSMRALFEDLELDVIRKLMDVNFWGTVYCSKYALPHLLASKGSLVGIISIAGYIGLPGRTGYSASKYAIRGFLDTVRVENIKNGLHVLVAAPGFTASNVRNVALTANGTAQGETPRDESSMMSAQEVAQRVINAIDRRKRSLILTFVEGKFTVWLGKWWPSLLDKLSYNHMAKEPNSPFK